jgi:hypothetical protein
MKLVYSIEDKFYWIHNFLPITEYKLIHNKVFKDRKKLNYNSTKNTWQKQLIDNINAPNKVSVKDNDFDFYKQSLLKLPFLKHKDNNIEVIIHNMGKNAGINWHADSHVRYGVTYYINKRWNPDQEPRSLCLETLWGNHKALQRIKNHGAKRKRPEA